MKDVRHLGIDMQSSGDARAWVEAQIAAMLFRQEGVVGLWQLLELGLGAGAIKHRLRIGRYIAIYPGVYAVGHAKLSRLGRLWAAMLAGGPGALLSHQTAGNEWAVLLSPNAALIHVTTVHRRRRRLGNIVFHRTKQIHPNDRDTCNGIPITSVPRTLLDLAESVPANRLRRAFEKSIHIGLFDKTALDELLQRSHGRHGIKPLTALAATSLEEPPELRSDLEHRFRELCEQHNLPVPNFNVDILGHCVDAYWPNEHLVVEVDSWEFHSSREAFEADRTRDRELQVAGISVMRVTDRALERESGVVAGQIRMALRRVA